MYSSLPSGFRGRETGCPVPPEGMNKTSLSFIPALATLLEYLAQDLGVGRIAEFKLEHDHFVFPPNLGFAHARLGFEPIGHRLVIIGNLGKLDPKCRNLGAIL